MLWVISQLSTSFAMHVHGNTPFDQVTAIDKLHIYGGVCLFIPAVLFFALVLYRRKVTDLYPWLTGNWSALKDDLRSLVRFRLPEPSPGGLAATVEGLVYWHCCWRLPPVCCGFLP
ncbi:hypothetical protein [Kistimonas scapharcae]|uniref:hypothetical protein n=1 Tax=Kistimonas scapharcae TaxID=1036133 RepID=UPI0031F157DF